MLPDESKKMANNMLPAAGSTLLCWDAEGLWGKKIADGSRPFDERSIMRLLGGHTIGDYFRDKPETAGGGCPKKAARLYVFSRRPGTGADTQIPQKYDCDVIDVRKDKDGRRFFALVAEIHPNEATGRNTITEPKSGNLQEIVLPSL